jgi:peptide/nickel transport system substrate-binding protein
VQTIGLTIEPLLVETKLRRTPMGRKSFAKRMIVLSAILALVLAACGEDTTGTTSEGSDTTSGGAGGDVPNPDVLIATVNDDVFNLDPAAVNGNDVGMDVILNVYDRLVFLHPEDGSVIPQLATEVPSTDNGLLSEDGLTYTFPLR